MENENLKNRIDELEKRIKDLEEVRNLNFIKLIRENVFGQPSGPNDAAVDQTITITIGAGGGTDTEQVFGFPDGFLDAIRPNGERVKLPFYNKSRF